MTVPIEPLEVLHNSSIATLDVVIALANDLLTCTALLLAHSCSHSL